MLLLRVYLMSVVLSLFSFFLCMCVRDLAVLFVLFCFCDSVCAADLFVFFFS